MDATQVAQLLASFQAIATSNQPMMQNLQATTGTGVTPIQATTPTTRDAAANVALTSIKVPLDMGDSAEERLVNFYEWIEEVKDKMTVADVTDQKRQTTIALMWGGKDVKDFAVEKAGVQLHDDNSGETQIQADTWDSAVTKIKTVMEEGINEAFAMFKFGQLEQGNLSMPA